MNRLWALFSQIAPIASLFLVLAGVLLLRQQLWTAGGLCLLMAMTALIAEVRFPERFTAGRDEPGALRFQWIPAALWMAVAGLNGVAILSVIDLTPTAAENRLGAAAWMGSVVIGLLTIWFTGSETGRLRRFGNRIAANRNELTLLLAVVGIALAMRTIALSTHPYPWSGDESSVAHEASRILEGTTTRFFDTGWSGQPNWSFVPTAVLHALLGDGILPTRLTSALIGTLSVVAVYLVARQLFDASTAVMAAALLATLPYHVHFSRLGFQNIVDSTMSSVVVWLAVRSVQTNDPRYYYTAGAAAGLTLYSYPGTRLALVLSVVALICWLYRERPGDGRRGLHVLMFVGAAILSAAPQAVYFSITPGRFLTRLGQEGILFNGWLTAHASETGVSVSRVLLNQFNDTVLTFVAQPAWGHVCPRVPQGPAAQYRAAAARDWCLHACAGADPVCRPAGVSRMAGA